MNATPTVSDSPASLLRRLAQARIVLRDYYVLAKPGIVYGNAIAAAAGYFLASAGHPVLGLSFVAMIGGLSLVIASGCVFNNYIDQDIDCQMARTQERPLITGRVSGSGALVYGSLLGVAGVAVLATLTTVGAVIAAALGWIGYVLVYSLWAKRSTVLGTHIGAFSGAMPPVVGYLAVANQLNAAAILLFLILFTWQIPHFFAIVLTRADDYRKAHIPALPLVRSVRETRAFMLMYIGLVGAAAGTLWYVGYVGIGYLVVATLLCSAWFAYAAYGLFNTTAVRWPRRMFVLSLVVLLGLSLAMSLNAQQPQVVGAAIGTVS